MRGHAMRTPERVALVRKLRDEEKLPWREIADRLGIALTTAHGWYADPDGSKLRARQASYAGACAICGGPTSGTYGPGKAPELCKGCWMTAYWTRARILDAIQRWADDHGGIPPRSLDWGNGPGHYNRRTEYVHGEYPHAHTVAHVFGSFNRALDAAGYEPHRRRKADRYEDGTIIAEAVERIRKGEAAAAVSREIGQRLGLCDDAVRTALQNRGLTVAAIRAEAA